MAEKLSQGVMATLFAWKENSTFCERSTFDIETAPPQNGFVHLVDQLTVNRHTLICCRYRCRINTNARSRSRSRTHVIRTHVIRTTHTRTTTVAIENSFHWGTWSRSWGRYPKNENALRVYRKIFIFLFFALLILLKTTENCYASELIEFGLNTDTVSVFFPLNLFSWEKFVTC